MAAGLAWAGVPQAWTSGGSSQGLLLSSAGQPDMAEILWVPRHCSITTDSPALQSCRGYPDIAEVLGGTLTLQRCQRCPGFTEVPWVPQKLPVTSHAWCKLCPRGICRTQASSSQACLRVEQKWRGCSPSPPASFACLTKLKIPREKISLVFCNILPLSVFANPVSQSVGWLRSSTVSEGHPSPTLLCSSGRNKGTCKQF